MPVWTEQQNSAINASNGNIIVSAAAGSGKTAVLVERVVRIITNKERPVDIDKLLIVTFTRPAAAEMKSRISQRLQKILSENPTDKCALKQLSLLPCAKVCTIDSFCLDLVKENFFELGINRDFNVLDEAEAQIIADNALNNVLDACFEESNKNFIALTEMLSSPKDDKNLISSLKRVYSYIYSQPFPFEWLDNAASAYNPDTKLEKSVWISSVNDFVTDGLNCGINLINECISLLDVNDESYDKYFDALNSDLSVYRSLMKSLSDGWDASKSAFENISFCTLRGKKGHTPPYKEEIALRRNVYKDIVKKLSDFFCESEKEFYEDNTKIYPVIKELCKVIKLFDDEYRKLKDERNAYTFSDIEHFAISLFINKDESGQTQKSRLALDLESSFYEILVDEYQDTNEAQDALFSVLSNGKNRFMVGDVKQSIYRFRLAMPFIFNEKKEKFINYSKDKYNLNSKIILDKNFRSRQGICDYVNFLFSAVMSEKTGELNYNENEYLNYGADYPKTTVPSVSFKILDCTKSADADKSEAIFIARTVLDKINSNEQVYDAKLKKNRRLQYGDFAILLRSVKNHISVYNEVLSSFGIPVICDNSTNLFENNEIKILISFLRVIDNPMQDIPLLALMMSPLYGFSADELTEIKLENGNKNVSLYTSVINSKSKKVANFLDELEAFRKIAITMSVSSFIRFICLYKNLYAFANALGNGEQRCKNINKFISFAENFDSSQSIGLTSFMRLVNKTAQSDKGIESAAVNSSSENAVSVMSVHHSKGLEFPVVILAGTERKYNYDDLKQKIQLHPKFGIGVKVHNEEQLFQTETIPDLVIKNLNKNAVMSENLRVLYVAVTRAKEQFIPFITVENLESKINKLAVNSASGNISPYLCKNIQCDGDLLLMTLLNHSKADKLRAFSDIGINIRPTDFDVEIDIRNSVDEISEPDACDPLPFSADIIREIDEKVKYKYSNSFLSEISAKKNASELDENETDFDFFASSKPAFMSSGKMTAGQKGTAMHTFMQYCDYENSKKDLESEIQRLAENGFISSEQAAVLNRESLNSFFSGELAKRMFNSSAIYREMRVSSFVKLSEIGNIKSDEEILVRGVSDCVFEENGELVLVDYKTDKVKNEKELLERYKNQIAFYKSAVSKILKKPVKQAVLYSFYLKKECAY